MKTLNEYLALPYRMEIVEDREEGGYVVSYPDLPGCLTCGETIESAVENARDAKRVWLEAALKRAYPFRSRTVWRITPGSSSPPAPQPAPRSGGALPAGRHQHESVLRLPAGKK